MNQLRKAVNFHQAQKNFDKIKANVDFETCGPDALLPLIAARDLRDAARKSYRRLSCAARKDAMDQVEHARVLSRYWGAELSGKCTRVLKWGTSVSASSTSSKGARYSSGCSYRKTDITHTITLCPERSSVRKPPAPVHGAGAKHGSATGLVATGSQHARS